MAKQKEIGTRVYYRGDMANSDGFGTITSIRSDKYANWTEITLDDGRTLRPNTSMISDTDSGNGLTRIVTLAAYNKRLAEQVNGIYLMAK